MLLRFMFAFTLSVSKHMQDIDIWISDRRLTRSGCLQPCTTASSSSCCACAASSVVRYVTIAQAPQEGSGLLHMTQTSDDPGNSRITSALVMSLGRQPTQSCGPGGCTQLARNGPSMAPALRERGAKGRAGIGARTASKRQIEQQSLRQKQHDIEISRYQMEELI